MIGRDRAGLVYGVGGDQDVVGGLHLLHDQRDQTTGIESAIFGQSEPDWRAQDPSGREGIPFSKHSSGQGSIDANPLLTTESISAGSNVQSHYAKRGGNNGQPQPAGCALPPSLANGSPGWLHARSKCSSSPATRIRGQRELIERRPSKGDVAARLSVVLGVPAMLSGA